MIGNAGTSSFDFDALFWEHVVRMNEWTEGWSLRLCGRGSPHLSREGSSVFLIGSQVPAYEGHPAFSLLHGLVF